MFHTCAYSGTTVANTELDVTPVTDGNMVIQNGHFLPQVDMNMLYAAGIGATITKARIVTPTLRQITSPYIRPLIASANPGDLPYSADYSMNPFTLKGLEEVSFRVTDTAAVVVFGVLGLARSPQMPAPQGNIYTMQGTGTTTLTAAGWTQVSITWQDSLPAGLYACVGFQAQSATCVAARLTFENQWERPGCVGIDTLAHRGDPIFRMGRLGVWGNFSSYRLPNVEFLATSADTTETVYLDFIRIG